MRAFLIILALVAIAFTAVQMVDFHIGWGERGTGAYSGDTLPPEIIAESERRAIEAARKAGEAADAARAAGQQPGRD